MRPGAASDSSFQEITINPLLTVAENILAGRLASFRRNGLLRRSALNRAAQALLDSADSAHATSMHFHCPRSRADSG
jgi:ABC-type sugar transport system ATPase subunit